MVTVQPPPPTVNSISGTATILAGSTSVTVTHGLGDTPAWVGNPTPLDEYGLGAWVSLIGATTFQINIQVPQAVDADFIYTAGNAQPPQVIANIVSGTATIPAGSTSVVVTHGLGSTPIWVGNPVPLDENGLGAWITSIGVVTFQINIQVPQAADADYMYIVGN